VQFTLFGRGKKNQRSKNQV